MRFLGIGDYNSLGDMHWRSAQAGHEVRVYVGKVEGHSVFRGMLDRVDDWRAQLDWIREAGDDGILVFESASQGGLADELRRDGFRVIGGSAFGDRLETDRAFGQDVLRDAGLQTAVTHEFDSFNAGLAFLARHPGRYVYKLSDSVSASTRNYVGELDSGADVAALLQMERDLRAEDTNTSFILMQHLQGVEVGIGGYFNGEEFLAPAVIDWEHKRFFPGDLGELTGEMGTVVSYRGSQRLFDLTLGRVAGRLREAGHVGYINLNTIVNARGIWPLEFTSRFGYPGFAVCDALHREDWASVFRKMVTRSSAALETTDGFAVGVVLTVPPFPYEYGYEELSKGAPIFFRDELDDADKVQLHYGEVELHQGQLRTSGSIGYIMVVTGVGSDVPAAQRAAYQRVRKIVVPNLRYRLDIGERLVREDLGTLEALGYYTMSDQGTPSSRR